MTGKQPETDNEVELKSLIGKHILSGVDFESHNEKIYGDLYRDCETVNFVLDGETYTAIQDPDDGYRSCMQEIRKSDVKVTNMFKPCNVLGRMQEEEIIEFVDIFTNKVVLSIGTDNSDQYYPCWVAEFIPENMLANQKDSTVERAFRILIETYSDLKDEIQDNPNCTLIANKKLVEIVNKLHDLNQLDELNREKQ